MPKKKPADEKKAVTYRISAALQKRFKMLSVEHDFDMQDVVESLIERYCKNKEKRK